MVKNKNICIGFLGNPNHDSRVSNLKFSLQEEGYSVNIISFDWRTIKSSFKTNSVKIFKLNRKNSFLFYFKFFSVLFFELLQSKSKIFFAEDIYTLPAVYFIAKIKRGKIYYDSREIYANLAGLRNKKIVQRIIETIEKLFITKVDLVITTGEMDTELLKEKFPVKEIVTLRNLPRLKTSIVKIDLRKKLNIPDEKLILLYQGVLLEGRGIEIILDVISKDEDLVFVLLGDGDFRNKFEKLTEDLKITQRVFFLGTYSQDELIKFTAAADLGLALIENISLSYYYALPNKLFEYIMAGVPILCSDLPQMKKIVEHYKVGEIVDISQKENLLETISNLKNDPELHRRYSQNCSAAADELNWQNEFKKVKDQLLL